MMRTHQWYQALLADLYQAIEGLCVSGYAWDATDGWTRSVNPLFPAEPGLHLEAWVNLGDPRMDGSLVEHAASVVHAVRYQADDDGMSQGILHASIRDLAELLRTWARADGARSMWTGSTISSPSPGSGWLVVETSFTLTYPWRA